MQIANCKLQIAESGPGLRQRRSAAGSTILNLQFAFRNLQFLLLLICIDWEAVTPRAAPVAGAATCASRLNAVHLPCNHQ
jgi:hypothetical protein